MRTILAAALAVAVLFGSAHTADAAFAVKFSDGTNTLTILDGSAQDGNLGDTTRITVNTTNALVIAFQAASGFNITGSTFSFRNGSLGGTQSVLTESETEIARTGVGFGTLHITVGYDGFTLPVGSEMFVNSTVSFSAITTTSGANYQFYNWADNVPPAQDLDNPTGVTATTGLYAFTTQIPPGSVPSLVTPQTVFNRTTTPFQMTSRSTINLSGNGDPNQGDFISFTATTNITAAPAPAGLVLLLSAVPALGIGAWLRRRRAQAAV